MISVSNLNREALFKKLETCCSSSSELVVIRGSYFNCVGIHSLGRRRRQGESGSRNSCPRRSRTDNGVGEGVSLIRISENISAGFDASLKNLEACTSGACKYWHFVWFLVSQVKGDLRSYAIVHYWVVCDCASIDVISFWYRGIVGVDIEAIGVPGDPGKRKQVASVLVDSREKLN